MFFGFTIPHLGLSAAVAIQVPDRPSEVTPRSRTVEDTPVRQTLKVGGIFRDTPSHVSITPDNSNRPTVPARDSVEEAWLNDVRRGAKTIGDVIRDAEKLRGLKIRNLRAFGAES